VTEQEKYDRMEEALKKPNSEWTFEKKGDTGFVVKCGGVAQVSGNLKLSADSPTVSGLVRPKSNLNILSLGSSEGSEQKLAHTQYRPLSKSCKSDGD